MTHYVVHYSLNSVLVYFVCWMYVFMIRSTFSAFKILAFLWLLFAMSGCKVPLYSDIPEKEGNQMLSILLSAGISVSKESGKEQMMTLLVEEEQLAEAVTILQRHGYPRDNFATIEQLFPKEGLISSPTEEKARLIYAKSQELAATLSQIDGVLKSRVHVVLPEKNERTGKKSEAAASVFIKHSSNVELSLDIPKIKLLVNNSIDELDYDNISVVMFPSSATDSLSSDVQPPYVTVFFVRVAPESVNMFYGVVGFIVFLSILTHILMFFSYRQV